MFEPRHYLKLPRMVAAKYYVGFVDGEAVCRIATAPRLEVGGMRACRMVVMPEWQGAGVGMKFLNEVCRLQFTDADQWNGRTKSVYFHTSRPGLCAALRRDKLWVQVSRMMGGGEQGWGTSKRLAKRSRKRQGRKTNLAVGLRQPYRAVQGFKMRGRSPYEYPGRRAKMVRGRSVPRLARLAGRVNQGRVRPQAATDWPGRLTSTACRLSRQAR